MPKCPSCGGEFAGLTYDLHARNCNKQPARLTCSACGAAQASHDALVAHQKRCRADLPAKEAPFDPLATTAPFPSKEEYSLASWFNYFWYEAAKAPGKTPPQKESLLRIFGELFDVKDNKTELKSSAAAWQDTDTTNGAHIAEIRTTLETFLGIGFESFADRARRAAQVQIPATLQTAAGRVYLGFRSDGRDAKTIRAHRGTIPQALVPARRRALNIDRPWHPFKDRGDRFYFRLGNQDNDLYTVVSVATDWTAASNFPLIEDTKYEGKKAAEEKPLSGWTAQEKANASSAGIEVVKVAMDSGLDREFLGTEATVYVVQLDAGILHTEALQRDRFKWVQPFPERGVKRVEFKDHLAAIKIRRVHHGPTRKDSMTIFFGEVDYLNGADRKWGGALVDYVNQLTTPQRQVTCSPENKPEDIGIAAIKKWGSRWQVNLQGTAKHRLGRPKLVGL